MVTRYHSWFSSEDACVNDPIPEEWQESNTVYKLSQNANNELEAQDISGEFNISRIITTGSLFDILT